MGKRIIQQARGKGSKTYRVRSKAYKYKIKMSKDIKDGLKVVRLVNSPAHSAPLAKVVYKNIKGQEDVFYIPAHKNMYEGQELSLNEVKPGNIMRLGDMPVKTHVYCIESHPKDGGKFVKTGGNFASIVRNSDDGVYVLMPSKKEKKFHKDCRAVIGIIAGHGRLDKPIVRAGKKHHMMKARNKLWPRTSPIKVNAIDHPFGSGRGKNPKSKIAKRNAPPGAKVGLIRPKRTGKRK